MSRICLVWSLGSSSNVDSMATSSILSRIMTLILCSNTNAIGSHQVVVQLEES